MRLLALSLLVALVIGCRPELRPGTVERIVPPGQTPYTGTAYGPGGLPAVDVSATGATPGEVYYTPASNVGLYQLLSQDFQEISQLANAVDEGRPIPSAEILAIYQSAKHARVGAMSRQLRTFARAAQRGRDFPDGARVFGSPSFLDTPVFDAIQGSGTAAGFSPGARRHAIQVGVQRIMSYWILQELMTAEMRLRDGNTGPTGAPQNVDEAWAIYMGVPQGTGFPFSLSATAQRGESDFSRWGMVDRPLRESLSKAQKAAATGSMPDFQAARREVESRLNAVFYLATARSMNEALRARSADEQAAGLAAYQTIQPNVATADAAADKTVVDYFRADPATLTPARRDETLGALNRAAAALGLAQSDLVSPSDFPQG